MTMQELEERVRNEVYENKDQGRFIADLERAFIHEGANTSQAKIAASLAWEQGYGYGYGYSEMMAHAWDLQPLFGAK